MMAPAIAEDVRLCRLQIGGVWYTPLVSRAGAILGPADAAILAETAAPAAGRRYIETVLADASTPRGWQRPFPIARFHTRGPLPLELGDSGLRIGTVEAIWVAPGPALHARAILRHTRLGAVTWRALEERLLSGVCAVAVLGDATEFVAVHLSPIADCCLATARVIRCWEEPASSLVGR